MRKIKYTDDLKFAAVKREVIEEVQEILDRLGMTKVALARLLDIQPSALGQSLSITKGLQLTTLVRMADVLECDVEINLIRRVPFPPDDASAMRV